MIFAWENRPVNAFTYELCAPIAVWFVIILMFVDPGEKSVPASSVTGLDKFMRELGKGRDEIEGGPLCFSRLCTRTWAIKGIRTHYCSDVAAFVEEYDHYCFWLGKPVGRGNHRLFLILMPIQALAALSHLSMSVHLALDELQQKEFDPAIFIFLMIVRLPILSGISMITFIFGFAVLFQCGMQLKLVLLNLTVIEALNYHRYDHFFVLSKRKADVVFRNPFDKGSILRNAFDFWWSRRRSDFGPPRPDAQDYVPAVTFRQCVCPC